MEEHLVLQQPLHPQPSALSRELPPSASGSRRALAALGALGGGSTLQRSRAGDSASSTFLKPSLRRGTKDYPSTQVRGGERLGNSPGKLPWELLLHL